MDTKFKKRNQVVSKEFTNLNFTASSIYEALKREYVKNGYYSSGATSRKDLAKLIDERRNFVMAAAIKELLNAGIIEKKSAKENSYILSFTERKKLIDQFELGIQWLVDGIAKKFFPTGKKGEITKVLAYCG